MQHIKALHEQRIIHGDDWLYFPIQTPRRQIGVLAVSNQGDPLSETLIEVLCYQTALAIEHTFLMQESEDIKLKHQRESLRSALLSSVFA